MDNNNYIYDSIFDAFEKIAPSSPLIQLKCCDGRFFSRTNEYQLLNMGNGYAAFPRFPMELYRGENQKYDTCKPSVYRNNDLDGIIIDKLRFIEFKNILQTFPQVKYAIEDNMIVDYLALAQHYEINTNLLDVTSEPEVAAYFATHKWINGIAVPVTDGIGCIRGFFPMQMMLESNPRLHMIGLQCFKRPGIQAAFGLELERDEDFGDMSWAVYFKQNEEASRLIHTNFHINQDKVKRLQEEEKTDYVDPSEIEDEISWLFPDEEIADIAKIVKNSKRISRAAVLEYGEACRSAMKNKGMSISERPIYELSEAHRMELENLYKGQPYGNVTLTTRLVCYPPKKD